LRCHLQKFMAVHPQEQLLIIRFSDRLPHLSHYQIPVSFFFSSVPGLECPIFQQCRKLLTI
jgi:hypothetical protein